MREAIGGTWLFGLVISFIVLFTSFIAVAVNYSKAFNIKNQIISTIEYEEGFNDASRGKIDAYLKSVGYAVHGDCQSGEGYPKGSYDGKYLYCVNIQKDTVPNYPIKRSAYDVTVFFRLDLPIMGSIFTFPVSGSSKRIMYANDN